MSSVTPDPRSITCFLRPIVLVAVAVIALTYGTATPASIALSSTRLIIPEQETEATVIVRSSDKPVLVQSWLEGNTPQADEDPPFAVTPPLGRLVVNGRQLLRVIYLGDDPSLPTDRESVYWLNVQEIPQAPKGNNQLQIAIRQRIKVFYRPSGLHGAAKDAPARLEWSAKTAHGNTVLTVRNPSAYHVSLGELLDGSDQELLQHPPMIAPFSSQDITVRHLGTQAKLTFVIVDDYGANRRYELQLAGAAKSQGKAIQPGD